MKDDKKKLGARVTPVIPIGVKIQKIAQNLMSKQAMLATAESCTGGLVAKQLTDLSGSSQWFERGFITYSNQSKVDMLGVDSKTLQKFGAVSESVAAEMASGAIKNSCAAYGVSITGVAGPGGGSAEKPVGTVCFGWATARDVIVETVLFAGDREQVRCQAAEYSMTKALTYFFNEN